MPLIEEENNMKLTYVKLCLDCDEVFYDGQQCPKCASKQWWFVSKWIDKEPEVVCNETYSCLREEADD